MRCKKCDKHKTEADYPIHSGGRLRTTCKDCRNARVRETYDPAKKAARHAERMKDPEYAERRRWANITARSLWTKEQSHAAWETQKGCCAICSVRMTRSGRKLATAVHHDHCHARRRTRALLCSTCNISLGFAKDDPNHPKLSTEAAAYLRHHQS